MQLTYKFKLYPTKEHEEKLIWTLEKCRFMYNELLERLNKRNKISKNVLQHLILKIKKENPELYEVYSKVLQYENHRLFCNLRNLSKLKRNGRKVGKLRFKSADWFKTFTYNQSGFKIIKCSTRYDRLHLSKIGDIPLIMHREIKYEMKQVTIKKYSSGEWYALISVKLNKGTLRTQNARKVGIDLGIIKYVYDSDGKYFDNPKHLTQSLKKLRKAQQRLSHRIKNSKNRLKQKIIVAKIHEKIANQRDDFLHKLSTYYVRTYGFIAIENLNINRLILLTYNARNIMDASWSKFIQILQYKAESAGVEVVKINPAGTTKTCSCCGRIVYKRLSQRKHECICGLSINRDYNSAIVILKRALGQELSEFTPVENKPLPTRASLSLKQEAIDYNQ